MPSNELSHLVRTHGHRNVLLRNLDLEIKSMKNNEK